MWFFYSSSKKSKNVGDHLKAINFFSSIVFLNDATKGRFLSFSPSSSSSPATRVGMSLGLSSKARANFRLESLNQARCNFLRASAHWGSTLKARAWLRAQKMGSFHLYQQQLVALCLFFWYLMKTMTRGGFSFDLKDVSWLKSSLLSFFLSSHPSKWRQLVTICGYKLVQVLLRLSFDSKGVTYKIRCDSFVWKHQCIISYCTISPFFEYLSTKVQYQDWGNKCYYKHIHRIYWLIRIS